VTVLRGLTYAICGLDTFNSTNVCTQFTPTADTSTVTITLPAHYTISGTLTDRSGNPAVNALVCAVSTTGQGAHSTTDSTGNFVINVAPGTYKLQVCSFGGNGLGNTYLQTDNSNAFIIDATSGNAAQNLQLDTVALNVIVKKADGNPVSSDSTYVASSNSGGTTLYPGRSAILFQGSTSSNTVPTDANGMTTATVLRGLNYTVCGLDPFNSSNVCTQFTPTDDTSIVTVSLPAHYTISGTINDRSGNPIVNASVCTVSTSRQGASSMSDSTGNFVINVAPGTYKLQVCSYSGGNGLGSTYIQTDNSNAFIIDATSGNATQNLQLDTVALNVTFLDQNNQPIQNASIYNVSSTNAGSTTLYSGRSDMLFQSGTSSNATLTDANGVSTATVLRGLVYTICGRDPVSQLAHCVNFVPTVEGVNNVVISEAAPPASPSGLSAPSATNQSPSLSWSSVNGAAHYDVYRDGNNIGSTTNTNYTDANVTEGSHSYFVEAVNSVGMSSDPSNSVTVVYDITAPTITASVDRQPNANGWYSGDVTVTYTCNDSLSGIQSCPTPVIVSTEGANEAIVGTVTDKAGNTASVTTNLNIDKTNPTITASLDNQPNANGWNNNVTITYTCNDSLSGIQSCPAPVTVSTEGANQVFTSTAVDNAGNTASVTTNLNVDKTAPTITASVSTPPNSNGWNNGAVTITFNCSDALSGVASCTSPVTVSTEGANQVVTGTGVDKAGNVSTTTAIVSIDSTKPTIVATQTPVANANGWNNTAVLVSFTCKDSLSGISSCSSPVTLSNEGKNQSASGTAVDNAGNTNTVTLAGINIDKTAPTASSANITPTPVHLNKPNTETITATAVDAGVVQSGVVGGEYYFDVDPGVGRGTVMTFSSTNNQLSATQLSNTFTKGNHTLYIRSRDAAGNWSTTTSTTFKVS
jgi:hypothetical protein